MKKVNVKNKSGSEEEKVKVIGGRGVGDWCWLGPWQPGPRLYYAPNNLHGTLDTDSQRFTDPKDNYSVYFSPLFMFVCFLRLPALYTWLITFYFLVLVICLLCLHVIRVHGKWLHSLGCFIIMYNFRFSSWTNIKSYHVDRWPIGHNETNQHKCW